MRPYSPAAGLKTKDAPEYLSASPGVVWMVKEPHSWNRLDQTNEMNLSAGPATGL